MATEIRPMVAGDAEEMAHLWGSLAALLSGAVTGEPTTARWLTAATPWAFEAAADAGAECRGWGAVMLRGEWPAGRASLPGGAFG